MKIIQNDNIKKTLKYAKIGEVFKVRNKLYMRIPMCFIKGICKNAVEINTGELAFFNKGMLLPVIDGYFIEE